MKVLLVVHQFLPEYFAGTEMLTFYIASELKRLGHEVHVFSGFPGAATLKESERFDDYVYENIPVKRFHHANVAMGAQSNTIEMSYNNLFVADYFCGFCKEIRPDVVHFLHLASHSVSIIDVCKKLGIPTVFTATDFWLVCPLSQLRLPNGDMCGGPKKDMSNCVGHLNPVVREKIIASLSLGDLGKIIEYAKKRTSFKKVLRFIYNLCPAWLFKLLISIPALNFTYKRADLSYVKAIKNRPGFILERIKKLDKILVPSRLMERILKSNGVNSKKMMFCPYGINTFPPLSKRKQIDKFIIGFIGTISEHKGTHILAKALSLLEGNMAVEIRIYGKLNEDPNHVENLKKIVNNDPRFIFCGSFSNDKIGEVFADLDVLVVPSIWYENTPLVIYSAQVARCPVIASNLEGMAEVIKHRVNGLLFERGNAQELADAIRLLANDRILLLQLRNNAMKPKSSQEYVGELLRVYTEIIKKNKDRGLI